MPNQPQQPKMNLFHEPEQTSFDDLPSGLSESVANQEAEQAIPVECLGLTFSNEAARRSYFSDRLREKLADPAFRKIEGTHLRLEQA
ncbi:MAG: hypothetical protein WCS37_10475 [Chloroflexota bacterium]|nr:hypothetical protein [Chloroflexota bacterium]